MSVDRSPTSDRETARIVRSWLSEGTTRLPDRVLDAVLDEVPSTPQRRAWWPAWRFSDMNNTLRIALAAVAVVAIAFVGFSLLPRSNDLGGGAQSSTPSTAPTATATPTPSPTTALRLPLAGAIAPGRYTVEVRDAPITVDLTLPVATDGGAWKSGGWYVYSDTMNAAVSLWSAANVPADPCDMPASLPDPPVGPTVDDLVSALDAQANTDLSAAADVTVGGHAGKRFVMTYSESPACLGDIPFVMWTAPNGEYRAIEPGIGETVYVLDVDGQRLVIAAAYDPADIPVSTNVNDVIDSMEFVVH